MNVLDDAKYWQKSPDFRNLVRVVGTSIDGNRTLAFGLSEIRGVGRRFAIAVCYVGGYDASTRIGLLSDEDFEKIEKIIKDPISFGIPKWMVNRPKDLRTGEYRHVTGNDLELVHKMDLDRMKRMRSWKGIRHMFNLKVRGQHTRTTGRTGLVVGYLRGKKKTSATKGD
jgi:small subunit ribosomal protein S13